MRVFGNIVLRRTFGTGTVEARLDKEICITENVIIYTLHQMFR
jgi:hypothetical protein